MRDTIDMAREAGHMVIDDYYTNGPVRAFSAEQLKAFEALVRANEREIVMNEPINKEHWQRFEDEIRADEREACAKVCDEVGLFHEVSQGADLAFDLAAAIRARGNT